MDTFKKPLILIGLLFVCSVALASTQASRQYNFVDDRNNTIPITASRVDAELDNIITKLNQKVIIKSSAPTSPVAGMLWYDSANKLLKQYRNSEWVGVGVHVSISAPSIAQEGDVWYDSANNVIKIYNGSSWDLTLPDQSGHPNSYLKTDGSSSDWDQIDLDANVYGILPLANGGAGRNISGLTVDGIVYATSTGLYSTSAGTSGQYLKSNGAGVAPSYDTFPKGIKLVSTTTITASAESSNILISSGKHYIAIFYGDSSQAGSNWYIVPSSTTQKTVMATTDASTVSGQVNIFSVYSSKQKWQTSFINAGTTLTQTGFSVDESTYFTFKCSDTFSGVVYLYELEV